MEQFKEISKIYLKDLIRNDWASYGYIISLILFSITYYKTPKGYYHPKLTALYMGVGLSCFVIFLLPLLNKVLGLNKTLSVGGVLIVSILVIILSLHFTIIKKSVETNNTIEQNKLQAGVQWIYQLMNMVFVALYAYFGIYKKFSNPGEFNMGIFIYPLIIISTAVLTKFIRPGIEHNIEGSEEQLIKNNVYKIVILGIFLLSTLVGIITYNIRKSGIKGLFPILPLIISFVMMSYFTIKGIIGQLNIREGIEKYYRNLMVETPTTTESFQDLPMRVVNIQESQNSLKYQRTFRDLTILIPLVFLCITLVLNHLFNKLDVNVFTKLYINMAILTIFVMFIQGVYSENNLVLPIFRELNQLGGKNTMLYIAIILGLLTTILNFMTIKNKTDIPNKLSIDGKYPRILASMILLGGTMAASHFFGKFVAYTTDQSSTILSDFKTKGEAAIIQSNKILQINASIEEKIRQLQSELESIYNLMNNSHKFPSIENNTLYGSGTINKIPIWQLYWLMINRNSLLVEQDSEPNPAPMPTDTPTTTILTNDDKPEGMDTHINNIVAIYENLLGFTGHTNNIPAVVQFVKTNKKQLYTKNPSTGYYEVKELFVIKLRTLQQKPQNFTNTIDISNVPFEIIPVQPPE